ncbi:MAG: glycosyltransferase family 4 protein [Bacteroidota bacterium]|nr:glycosyltransferase family 4 protein [Bacteroidota bacterium]
MKIGFDAKRAFLNYTGLGNYSRFVINALSNKFRDNDYFLYAPYQGVDPEAKLLISLNNVHLRTPSSIVAKMNLGSIWRSAIVGNVALKDGVDIFHGLSNELPLILDKKLKTVVTIHDLLFIRYPELYNFIDVEIYKRKVKHACKVANKIIAVSEQTGEDLKDFLGVDPSKIDVVYQGCHRAFKKEYPPLDLNIVIDKYNLPDDFILNVGTIEARKNVLLIIKALSHIKKKFDIPVVIIGRATKYKNELVAWAKKEGILNQIIFLHDVPFEDLPKIFQLSKLFIYPSKFEGFGIPIIEALSSQVPVISSTGSCFSEAGGEDSIYIDPEDPEALGDAILSVFNNPSMTSKMIMKGNEYVKKFDDDNIASNLNAVYEKLVLD